MKRPPRSQAMDSAPGYRARGRLCSKANECKRIADKSDWLKALETWQADQSPNKVLTLPNVTKAGR